MHAIACSWTVYGWGRLLTGGLQRRACRPLEGAHLEQLVSGRSRHTLYWSPSDSSLKVSMVKKVKSMLKIIRKETWNKMADTIMLFYRSMVQTNLEH